MHRFQKLKSLLLLLFVAVTTQAQISEGNVYNFVNVGNSTQSLVIDVNNNVSIATTNISDYDQLWYVSKNSDNSYSLRNLGSGRYLRSSNAASEKWSMVKTEDVDDNCKFSCTAAGSGYAFRATNTTAGGHYMHYGANQGLVVGWSADAAATQWTITPVSVDRSTLEANWETLASVDPRVSTIEAYQANLELLFSDNACTTLNSSYASMDEATLKNQTEYKGLPATLQNMVLKVRNEDDESWDESNLGGKPSWGALYAKKYRVQLYEPYNEPEEAAKALGINAHTNLNNPTGIFANNNEAIYVMVEGAIKDGASLYITSYKGHGKLGGYQEGFELKEGLNVIPSSFDGVNYCINYVVHTFDTSDDKRGSAAKTRRLSDYPDLKIHIEGGHINGYWNKMGDELYSSDTDSDWEYIEERATQTDVTVLGEYITLQFPLNDADTDGNRGLGSFFNEKVHVGNVVNSWDNIMMWERFLLGVLDENTTTTRNTKSPYSDEARVIDYTGNDSEFATGYGDYYNVHGLSYGVNYNYMFGSWDHCGYNFNTMGDIIELIPVSAGAHWGPAHEIGHQHQMLITMRGETEVSNNLFSNVVMWYFGQTTSRVNGTNGSLENLLTNFNSEGGHYLSNNIWTMTQMYYKLFLYYHALGHNTKFYPRLFEMLRQDPMSGMGGNVDGSKAQLHLYKKVCQAAGEDLTEFFRAHGFFTPLYGYEKDDYGKSTYNMTQAQIDAAIAEVKSWNYKENVAVLFVNDATNEQVESHKGGYLNIFDKEDDGTPIYNAEVGGYASFNANTAPNYTYAVSGNTVTMKGEGGIGFAIFNEKDELVAFSDKKTFAISEECAAALASNRAVVKAVQADNTRVEATDVMDTDNAEAKYAALGELLTAAADLLTYSDADNSKPGFYKASAMETLLQLYAEAQNVYDDKEVNYYATAYEALYQEYLHVSTLETDRTPFLPGSTYVLTNKKYPTVAMTVADGGLMGVSVSNSNMSSARQWTFEATDEKDVYYLKNGSSYLGSLLQSTQVGVTTKELASRYKLFDLGKGLWALQCQNDSGELQSLHCNANYKIVGWTHTATDNDASWWYLTATAKDESMLPLYDLQNLIVKAEALVDEMATVQGKGTVVKLSEENVSSNTPESGHEAKYLVDGNPSTFFHTNWMGTAVSEYHNIVIDLGAQYSLAEFVLNYKTLPTSANNVDAPTSMIVSGCNDGSSYSTIATLSGLPVTKGAEYTSGTLGSTSHLYRYIRLQVTDATGGSLGSYKYFGLAELELIRMSTLVETIDDKYSNFISVDAVKAVCDQLYAAQQTYASGSATTNDVEAMQVQYDILLEAYENANNVEFNAKQQELLTLIGNTNSLINTCGTVTYTAETVNAELVLQTTDPNGDNYLSTNAQEALGAHCLSNILDYDNAGNHFHSAWSWDANEIHHLKVDLGNGKSLNEFTFTYRTAARPYPYEIKVYGSNDDTSYLHLATFSKDDAANRLPTTTASDDAYKEFWTSSVISSDAAYRYLRFDVTNSGGTYSNANPYGEYCFTMSYFGITSISETERYTIEWGTDVGNVTEELLLTTYKTVQAAQTVCERATTVTQLQNVIDELTDQYDILYAAKYLSVVYTILSNVTGGGVTFEGGDPCAGGGTLAVPASLTLDALKAKLAAIDLTKDGYIAQSITIDENVISVTYNKVYTICVNGGEGNGRITYDGIAYAHGGTLNVLQGSFTEADLTANDVEGYNKSEVTVNHEAGIISVVYTLDRSGLEGLIVQTDELMQTCQAFLNSAYVTEQLLANTNNAIDEAREKLVEELTYAEYTDAVSALQFAYDTLNTAKDDAENEAAARNEKREYLNILIDNTNELITLCRETPGDATEALIDEVSAAVTFAEEVAGYVGSTVDELTSATVILQDKYNVLIAAQQSTAKTELRALIDQTTALIAQCGTIECVTTTAPVALHTETAGANGWLSTNAQESREGDIANLLQDDGFFHSSWSAQVGAAHYLQVDMGADYALKEFAFSYTTRDNGGGGPHPSTIVVSGGNDKDGSFVELAMFNEGLPTTGNSCWNAAGEQVVAASQTCRYLRFTVTASVGTNGCKHDNGEYYFAMARFSLTSISHGYTVELLNSNVAEELLIDVYQANETATTLANISAVQAELVEAKESLQALYDALLEASTSVNLPVTLTTDATTPVLYTIKTKRANGPVLQYDETTEMFDVTTAVAGKATQVFYFMKGDKTEGAQQVYIYPYLADGKVLAANDVGDGDSKALAMDKSTAAYEQWVFVEQADGYYNLQPSGTNTYLSNIYGTDRKMGFYGSSPDSDEGSLFKFEVATVEGGYYYLKLKDYYNTQVKVASSEIQGGTAVGYYPAEQAGVYNAAYAAATAVLANTATTEADCQTAYVNLVAANEALVMNMPSADKYYRFVSVDTKNDRVGGIVYADPKDNKMYWSKDKGANDATAMWSITASDTEGLYHVTNLHTGSSINGFISYKPSPLNETAGDVSIVSLSGDGQVGVKCNGTMMHAADADKAVVTWNTGANDASAWRIVEVEAAAIHTLVVGVAGWSTLMLGYNTTIPSGVEVYAMSEIEDDWATLTLVEGVLPAGEAVLVKANAGSYGFVCTADEGTIESNILDGSTIAKKVSSVADGVVYTLQQNDEGQVVFMQYANEEEPETELELAANKAYLVLPANTSAISIRFGEGTADMVSSEIKNQNSEMVFDLMGRRVPIAIKGGIYVVNGKRMLVK